MANKEKYLDKNFSPRERAEDLVSRMTLEEKASQLRYDAPGIERLGIPRYNWWNEALHGVARAGTATVFPQAIGLAAMFDDEFLQDIADTISTEARAKYNAYSSKDDRDIYKGLTMWSPNINIFRDPRWGRGHETYGEDPYLTTRLGVAFVKGLQGEGEVMKTAACAKHFAVHSGPEGLRHEFDAVATKKDMYETYLPAFEACVKEAGVESVMGAYNRTNGEPCNGSKTLLNDILREKWGFSGHVVSDCWAIKDFHVNHKVTKTATESVAMAIKNGCDLNCGNMYLNLLLAHQEGLVTDENITRSAVRMFTTRMKLGLFDDDCEYDSIPYEVNDCKEHNQKALEAARKSVVMLKNNGILPLDKKSLKSIAVIGPNADSQIAMYGNYNGTASRMITMLEGVHEAVGDDVRVYYSEGCHLFKDRAENLALPDDRIAEAVSVAEHADVTLLCVGLDSLIEGEEGDEGNAYAGGDKATLDLPGRQQKLVEAVVATGKPVIMVLFAGSAMAVGYAEENCAAVLDAWYPGAWGGRAVADILFGKVSPSGKLPVTFYKSTDDLPDFTDYSMANRTYRYYKGETLYPFGYGLTYSATELSDLQAPESGVAGADIDLSVKISNTGQMECEQVVQCYIKDMQSKFAVENYSLSAFKRVKLAAGETQQVKLTIPAYMLDAVNDEGERVLDSSQFKIWVGTSQPDKRSEELTGQTPLSFDYIIK